jgi:hypothetical protein
MANGGLKIDGPRLRWKSKHCIDTLPQSWIALSAKDFLEEQNKTARESVVSLAADIDLQENGYSRMLNQIAKVIPCFLSVITNRQGNYSFPWVLFEMAKVIHISLSAIRDHQGNSYLLGCNLKHPRKFSEL